MFSSVCNALELTLLLGLMVCATAWAQTGAHQLALTHVTVINASQTSPHPDSTVLIANDSVVEVGPSKSVKVPRGALIVDASGKFLIPALWDMHVHTQNAERDFPMFVANGWAARRRIPVVFLETHRNRIARVRPLLLR